MIIALPLLLPDAVFKAICGFMGLVFALLGVTAWLTPGQGIARDASAAGGKLSPLATRSSVLALVVIALYFGGLSGVWAFSERLAETWGYNSMLVVCGAISALCLLPLLMLDQSSRRGKAA